MPSQIVPLSTSPNVAQTVTLDIDASPITLNLITRFSTMAGYWVLTILDQFNNLLLDSIPMITGSYPAGNILGQYGYLEIGSAFVINQSGVAQDYPDSTNLGTDFVLVWSDTPGYVADVAA